MSEGLVIFNLESFSEKISRKEKIKVPEILNKQAKYHYVEKEYIKPVKEIKHKLECKEWFNLRAQVISIHGEYCLKCGIKPDKKDLHIDHIKPKSKYPELIYDKDNLQVLCKSCNFKKSNKDETDYRVVSN